MKVQEASRLFRRGLSGAALLCLVPGHGFGSAQARAREAGAADRLQVFFIDVEGGQATLFVTPDRHSLLIDTGWPDNNGRDADRIAAAVKQAGLQQLDDVLLTHYHVDHVGGVEQLVARVPVKTFLDHGPNRELDAGPTEKAFAEYQKVLASSHAEHRTLHPGEQVHVGELTLDVISSDGHLLASPLPGAGGSNSFCATSEHRPADTTENSRSLGVRLSFGRLTLLDLGDLTWDKELELMCPTNKLGHVDVLIVSHHGWYQSSSPALVRAVAPEVAVMDNGQKKGGSTPTLVTLHGIPTWQLHYSDEGGSQWNAPPSYVANPQGTDAGFYLKLTANRNGSFSIFNARTEESESYPAQPKRAAVAGQH